MAGAIVQRKENSAAGSATTIASGTLASDVTSGNYLWIVTSHGTSSPTTSISQNGGTATIGTVTSQGAIAEAGVDDELEHFTCQVTGTGTLDILATFSGADTERCIVVVEISGVNAVDGSSEQTDTGNNPTNPDCVVNVTAQPAFGLMCLANYQGAGSGAGSGWTLDGANMWSSVIGEGLIQTKAISATGNTSGNFANAGLDRNNSVMVVFTDGGGAPPAPTVTVVSPWLIYDTQTGILVLGTTFEASQGTGTVIISPTDDVADAGAVTQTVTAWADTSITITAVRGSLGTGTLYLFVTNNTGDSNASGYPVKFVTSAKLAWTRN